MITLKEDGTVEMPLEVFQALTLHTPHRVFLHKRFQQLVNDRYRTQKIAAQDLGVSSASLSAVMHGKLLPSENFLKSVERGFHPSLYFTDVPQVQEDASNGLIDWKKFFLLVQNTSPQKRRACRLLLKGRSYTQLAERGFVCKPDKLFELCELIGIDPTQVLTAKLPLHTPSVFKDVKKKCLERQGNLFLAVFNAMKSNPTKLSSQVGISRSTLQNWLDGKSKPNLSSYVKVCQFFEVPFDYWTPWLG